MKVPLKSAMSSAPVLVASLLAAIVWSASAAAPAGPTKSKLANIDVRAAVPLSGPELEYRATAENLLKSQLPTVKVSYDSLLGTPSFVRSTSSFLTGANGRGLTVSTQKSAAPGDNYYPVKAFLDEHAMLFGFGAEALADAAVNREGVTAHNGMRTIVWQQRLDGLPVFNSVLIGNISAQGQLITVASRFLPNLSQLADAGNPNRAALQSQPAVSAEQAIAAAAQNVGASLATGEVITGETTVYGDGYKHYVAGGRPAYARMAWLPMNRASMRLAWEVIVQRPASPEMFQILVDAENGNILVRYARTADIADATYNVYTSDSPSPFSPGWPTPNNGQPATVNRSMVTISAFDTTASPNGWINDADNETQGNNVDAFLDRDFDSQPDGARPQGAGTNRVFDFALNLAQQPQNYADAAVVNLFYGFNLYHDKLYQLGFTEPFGNFQNNNFGRGGFGNDRVIAHAQSGADVGFVDNANFGTLPDGFNGVCNMFEWTGANPRRDGDLDAEIYMHEATHGTSTRLVGGGALINALQTGGMGEGWSDFYALSLLFEPGDNPDAVYAAGGYVTRGLGGLAENYYFGVRHFPYTTDMTKNPFTFKDIDPTQISAHAGVPRSSIYPFDPFEGPEVHHQGEIWCVTLWDCRAQLFHKYGDSANLLMLRMVTDAMKLCPVDPTFLESRDTIILANLVDNAGLDTAELWRAFARRGMGFSAICPPNNTTTGVQEAFDTPGLQLESLTIFGGNGNGVIDFNECNNIEIVLRNNTGQPATGVSVRLSTSTPGVGFGSRVSTFPDLANSQVATNITGLTLSTSPSFSCGSPIVLNVLVKSDQVTSTNVVVLNTGGVGTPIRYDSLAPAAIPDFNDAGTNSLVVVSNFPGVLTKATVAVYINHTFDDDLKLDLISPDGTVVTLSANHGGSGNNYGVACSPDNLRTVFDDSSTTPIGTGTAPFVGTFKPDQDLAAFVGKSGTNINGTWKLNVNDRFPTDIGIIQCWSLYLSPSSCVDGGGTCPGADVSLGMRALAEPVFIGSNLVYVITVTNTGPSDAKNTVVNQSLPFSVVPVTAVASQGSAGFAGNTMIANLGTLGIGGTATVTVTVTPAIAGVISSTAGVTSSETDPDTSNNSATVISHVNPATSDIAVGIFDSPDPTIVGAAVTYTISVTNKGPSTASGVNLTNTFALSMVVSTAVASQGTATINGNVVTCNVGTLTNNGRATITVTATPASVGVLGATVTGSGLQPDPVPGNNSASATTTVGPAANLGLTMVDVPDPVVVRSNWTYVISVTNAGPTDASGVVVNHTLPANVTLVSSNTTQGSLSQVGGTVVANVGNLNIGAGAIITVVVNATNSGIYTSSAAVAASQADPDSGNNVAGTTTTVAPRTVAIVAAGATITAESVSPANGALDLGETVTVQLRLRNAGNVPNTNLTATLLASGGVTSPTPNTAVNYGVLAPGGLPVGQPFTFTASGAAGATVTATLQLQDGANNLGTVNYAFVLPNVLTFANTNRISITDNQPIPWTAGPATPYPSTNAVSGVTGLVAKVTVTLSNLSHSFPDDIDMLLVGPGGQKVVLMSDAGGSQLVTNINVTFDDGASGAVPDGGPLLPTSYQPANYEGADSFNAPAPAAPYASTLSAFAGFNPNGNWSLYIMDDQTGDPGSIGKGWSLSFTTVTPVNQLADLGLSGVAVPGPALVAGNLTCTFTITNAGPNPATGVAFTNVVPGGALLLGASASQGSVSTNGSTVLASLGAINVGAVATVTVVIKPTGSGVLNSPASVASSETDLNLANNTASATATVNVPAADVGISQSVSNTLGGNVAIVLTVTNSGPQPALGLVITDVLPGGFSFVSTTAANFTNNSGTLTVGLGDIVSGGASTVVIVVSGSGSRTNVATLATVSNDGNLVNNSAAAVISPVVTVAGATLVSESGPVNGTVDPGETVTLSLSLQNSGTADSVNLVGNLQASGGVTPITTSQNYGSLVHGGAAVARNFSFVANGANGGVVVATLQLQDGADNLGTVAFAFNLPTTTTFSNTTAIVIPDHGGASPYPASITVSGMTGLVSYASVTLSGFTHGFPDDVDVMLVSPSGQKLVLMSDAGGGHSVSNLNLTFVDGALELPDSTVLSSTTYGSVDYETGDSFPAPAPGGVAVSALAGFNGSAPNGTWSLFVVDDATGDAGTISGGWSLTLTTLNAVNPVADLNIAMTDAPDPVLIGNGLTYTIGVTNSGPLAATGVIVTDVLPGSLTYVSSTTSQGTVTNSGNTITGVIGNLASGSGAVMTIRVTSSTPGPVVNTVTVSGVQTDLNSVNNTAQVTTTVNVPVAATLDAVNITNGIIEFTLSGQPNQTYVIQASTDLSTWVPVYTNATASNGILKVNNPGVPSFGQRFYRAVRILQ